MKYISLNNIFASLSREIKDNSVSDGEIIEWCGDALEAIQTPSTYEHAIRFAEVVDHQIVLPSHLHVILQVARNNTPEASVIAEEVITDPTVTTPDIPVALDAEGMPIHDYELAYYRPYFDLIGEYNILGDNNPWAAKYTPVRLANSTFFDTVVATDVNFADMYTTCEDEYTIIEDVLRFSFETGWVAVAYLRQKLDCVTGYPMIPDTVENRTAVEKYIVYKLKLIDFYQNRLGSESRLQKAERDWQWYCNQAKNKNMMPQTIDEWENLMNQRNYILPQTNRYYGFFGRLSHSENRNLMNYGRK